MEGFQKSCAVLYSGSVHNLELVLFVLVLLVGNEFCIHSNTHSGSIIGGTLVNAEGTARGNDWRDLILTQTEKEKLDLFKKKVAGRLPERFMETYFYLIRWLRARNFDVDKAWDMLNENIKWRQENRMANILSEDFSDLADDFPMTTDGHDKKNRPVGTQDFGRWDMRSASLVGKLPRVSRYIDYFFEQLVHQILAAQQNGQQVTRAIVLYDLEGFNFYQHLCPSCITLFIRLLIGLEAHYPGFCEEIIYINSPSFFSILFNALKPSMSQPTREAIKIFGSNKDQWGAYLRERIDSDQRYPSYGGTKKIISKF